MFIKENKRQVHQTLGESGMVDEINELSVTNERYVKNIYFPPSKQDMLNETTKDESPQDIINILNQLQGKTINL